MFENFFFQIWFSTNDGFTIDVYPLFALKIDFIVIAIAFTLFVALRIRKAIRNRKRKFVNKTVASDF